MSMTFKFLLTGEMKQYDRGGVFLIFASFRESNQMNQAGILASLVSGCLPINLYNDSGLRCLKHFSGATEQSYSCASARDFHTVPFWSCQQDLIQRVQIKIKEQSAIQRKDKFPEVSITYDIMLINIIQTICYKTEGLGRERGSWSMGHGFKRELAIGNWQLAVRQLGSGLTPYKTRLKVLD